MQCTADFHDQIADAGLPQAAGVVDDATAVELSEGIAPPAGLQNRACHFSGTRLLDRSDSCHEYLVDWSAHVVPRVSGHDSDGERPRDDYRRCSSGPNYHGAPQAPSAA